MNIWLDWIVILAVGPVLGASVIMLWTGKFPPPLSNKRANPILSTALLVAGLTATLVFGTPDLLQTTVQTLTGQ